MAVKSPINWFGGKFYMAKKIVDLFPQHKVYVEAFGGAGHVLFKKEQSLIEVFNDINKDLIDFFKVLRDQEKAIELQRLLQLTPHSRTEFGDCYNTWNEESHDVEKVRKWYVTLMQCYSKSFGNSSWSYSKSISRRNMSQTTSQWLNKIDKDLPAAVERLTTVQIENLDFDELIKKYDSDDTLFYLDPPYIHNPGKMFVDTTYNNAATTKGFYHKDIINLYTDGMVEAFRVLKKNGFLLVKCQDQIESSKQKWSHIEIYQNAIDLGYYAKDMFVLHQENKPHIQYKPQQHARRNHSYLWVFIKLN